MKIVIICVLLAFASPPDDLVEAAREGKRKRAKSRTEVITNEDVRQAKGNVTTTKAAPAPEPEAADVMSHEEAKAARIAAELRLEVAEANAEQLAAELARIEQQYYAEDDLDRRDRVIVRRFDEVRVRYDEAAKELETAYAWLEIALANRTWAAGEAFSMADCAAAPSLFYADWVHQIGDAYPAVRAYRARLLARPSMARCVEEARRYRHYFPLGAPDRD